MAQFLAASQGQPVRGALPPHRHGGRRHRPARPPRHRVGPHRRRVDGRDDRPDDGDRAPGRGCARSRRSCRPPATPRSVSPRPRRCRRCSARSPPRATRRSPASVETTPDHRQPGPLRRGERPQARRGGLRPLLPPGRRRSPAARHPRVGQPRRGPGGPRRAHPRDPRRRSTRSSPCPAASAPPSSSPVPSCSCSRRWATTCRSPLLPQIVDAITALAARSNACKRLTRKDLDVWTSLRPEDHRDRGHRPGPVHRHAAGRHGRRRRAHRPRRRTSRAATRPPRPPTSPTAVGARSASTSSTPTASRRCCRSASRPTASSRASGPGVMERLGLGPDAVLARNPKLVYGRMTGWGQEGPVLGLGRARHQLHRAGRRARADRPGGSGARCRRSTWSATSAAAACSSPSAWPAGSSTPSAAARARWSTPPWSTAPPCS